MSGKRPNPFSVPTEHRHWKPVHDYEGKEWGFVTTPESTIPRNERRTFRYQKRFSTTGILAVCCFLVFIVRLGMLQIAHGESLRQAADQNRIRLKDVPATRGVLYDRNGKLLVENVPNETLQLTPADLQHGGQFQQTIERVAAILGEPADVLTKEVEKKRSTSYQSVLFREHLTYAVTMRLRLIEETLPGFHVEDLSTRHYLGGDAFSHVIGYTGKISAEEASQKMKEGYQLDAQVGKNGLEAYYESLLKGVDGKEQVEVDAGGKEQRIVASEPPVVGDDLMLSIDAALQQKASERLTAMMESTHASGGALVALNPQNGEILAMVSAPTFDNNLFTSEIDSRGYQQLVHDERHPLFSRALAGQYPSGSTIKPFIAATALTEKVITPTTTVNSVGGIHIGRWFFPDWLPGGHGSTNVKKALAQSVNSFFYTIGGGTETFVGLGVQRIIAGLQRFGFGSALGIDLHGETPGLLPT
ncbi:MAG: penicillin-binding transpeptidase domain-containing protein, partial [bacterium]